MLFVSSRVTRVTRDTACVCQKCNERGGVMKRRNGGGILGYCLLARNNNIAAASSRGINTRAAVLHGPYMVSFRQVVCDFSGI